METFKADTVRNTEGPENRKAWVKGKMLNQGGLGVGEKVEFVINSGVTKTLVRQE